jgi:phosphoenolpyruvate carboxykinase (ATP)
VSRHGLNNQGLSKYRTAYWNLDPAALYEDSLKAGTAELAEGGALVVMTGEHTGRAPKDKFIVDEPSSSDQIWWGEVNARLSEDHFDGLYAKMQAHLAERDLYVQDVYAGADPAYRLAVRVVSESPWHSLFAHNMFLIPSHEERADFAPQFSVLHAPSLTAEPEHDGTNSPVFIVVNLARRLVLIGGSFYAGEIKKSVFSILNYLLPERDVLPMHCSANIGPAGDTAIFFGLSGTGKTTLSADSTRMLIGDDEHGWSENGVFNFEGGCYAKVIRLSPEAEPEIFATTRRYGTILENVVMDPASRRLDLDDGRYTENTRASYPIDFIPNSSESGVGGLPENIVMLTRTRPCTTSCPATRPGSPARKRAWARSPTRPSPPVSGRPSCRAIPRFMPRCCATRCATPAPSAGWSTRAGPAAPTASANAWPSPTPGPWCGPPSTAGWPRFPPPNTRISA